MKFGILTFGYNSFTYFNESLKKNGYYDTNLGDNAQSIAVRNIYRQMGISDDDMVPINRDLLPYYDGEDVALIMNGVFFKSSFPLPSCVTPIFIGFHAAEAIIAEQSAFLKEYEPIGCRDEWTTSIVQKYGINAYTTGCLTFTLPRRTEEPKDKKLLIVYGSGAGRLPLTALKYIPDHLVGTADLIYHRLPQNKFPITPVMVDDAEKYEEAIFARYCREATLVLTSLHHVAVPCMSFGIPVIICRERNDVRFSTVEKITQIYLPENLSQIDWDPAPADITEIRTALFNTVREKIADVMN